MAKSKTNDVTELTKEEQAALDALLGKAKDLEDEARAENGGNITYVSLAQKLTKAIDEDNAEMYIKGLQAKDFFIQSKKLKLGKNLRVIVLSFMDIYNEMAQDTKTKRFDKFVGIWHKEDAMNCPADPDNNFNRVTPRATKLIPVKWVAVLLPDFPELGVCIITFKSTGNIIARNWKKLVESSSDLSADLVFNLTSELIKKDDNSWYAIKPELEGNTKEIVGAKAYFDAVKASIEVREQYNKGNLVARKNPSLFAQQAPARVVSGEIEYKEEVEEDF